MAHILGLDAHASFHVVAVVVLVVAVGPLVPVLLVVLMQVLHSSTKQQHRRTDKAWQAQQFLHMQPAFLAPLSVVHTWLMPVTIIDAGPGQPWITSDAARLAWLMCLFAWYP